jgi:hypothetical protein
VILKNLVLLTRNFNVQKEAQKPSITTNILPNSEEASLSFQAVEPLKRWSDGARETFEDITSQPVVTVLNYAQEFGQFVKTLQ